MKKYLLIALLLLATTIASAQVGIGTVTPKAVLDIPATNTTTPTNQDGILIPRIAAFPITNPTIDQNGMLVFLTADLPSKPKGFYYWDNASTSWIGFAGDKGWAITGNAGTSALVNFMGTKDNQDVIFKRNNVRAGLLNNDDRNTSFGVAALNPASSGYHNSAFGANALAANVGGNNNMANGTSALAANTNGQGNTATGAFSLFDNTTGSYNTAAGISALENNITGAGNTSTGAMSLYYNTKGGDNVANGYNALILNTTASKNIAVGTNALSMQGFDNSNTAYDSNNVAVGINALSANNPTDATNGINNVAVGNNALKKNTTGFDNVAVGYNTMPNNTTGFHNVAFGNHALESNEDGINNVAIGYYSLRANTSGIDNYALGLSALSDNINGSRNIAIGPESVSNNTVGQNNIGIGYMSLYENVSGNYNIAIGEQALNNAATGSYGVAIGFGAMRYAFNPATPYDNYNTAIGYEAYRGSTNPAANAGNENTAIGYQSLLSTSSGYYNTAVGAKAMQGNIDGDSNTAVGNGALIGNTDGNNNVALGNNAMRLLDDSSFNIGLGYNVMPQFVSGAENIAIGASAMNNQTSGSRNIAIGRSVQLPSLTGSNQMSIGDVIYGANMINAGSGRIGIGVPVPTEKLEVAGKTKTTNLQVTTGAASGYVLTSDAAGNATWQVNPASDADFYEVGTTNAPNDINDNIFHIGNTAIGTTNTVNTCKLYVYDNQLTANLDGQSNIYAYRNRDSPNSGSGYSLTGTNMAVTGYNHWGDMYTFGTTGFCDNDSNRTGGILGANTGGTYWASLGYKASSTVTYGIYASAAPANGTGRMATGNLQMQTGIGAGFYGGLIGSWSKGNLIGHISSGSLFAAYNSGDEYTAGKQIELVETGHEKTAAYTVTSTEIVVYKKGKTILHHGSARVDFDKNYISLLGEIPVVTATAMGQCNGLYIESIDKNGFTIKELNNGASNVTVSWIAVGDRIDQANKAIPQNVLDKDFDGNINEVLFNENNKNQAAKGIWYEGNSFRFGKLPDASIQKIPENEKAQAR